jgi:microcystin-dependent protein
MSDPYIGEVRMFGGNFAPAGWAFCDGSVIEIASNPTLFTLIGTTYGGDGAQTFKLPDLRSRVPVHQGSGFVIGQAAGVETVTLSGPQMPPHTHLLQATSEGGVSVPGGALPATTVSPQAGTMLYGKGTTKPTTLSPQSITANTGGQPHENIQPYVCVSYIISLFGVFPSPQ